VEPWAFHRVRPLCTFAELQSVLDPLGYSITQKARVLDVLRGYTGRQPEDSDWLLEHGDTDSSFKAHFDFVILSEFDEKPLNEPLFEMEQAKTR